MQTKREATRRFLWIPTTALLIPMLVLLVFVSYAAAPSRLGGLSNFETKEPTEGLFRQSVTRLLASAFTGNATSDDTSFLLFDVSTGNLLASRWDNPEIPIPPGSLVKPFTALAYGKTHEFHFPTHHCTGQASGCWLPRGHGEVDITSAIAYSCNSYFRMLTVAMTRDQVAPTAGDFGLDLPPPGSSGPTLSGLGGDWRISPLHLARAFLELNRRREQPGVRQILAGMAESSRSGTGAAVGHSLRPLTALVKTGTAACTHGIKAPGDGFVVALVPAEQPQLLVLLRVHGVPGAKAALTVGRMLHQIYR